MSLSLAIRHDNTAAAAAPRPSFFALHPIPTSIPSPRDEIHKDIPGWAHVQLDLGFPFIVVPAAAFAFAFAFAAVRCASGVRRQSQDYVARSVFLLDVVVELDGRQADCGTTVPPFLLVVEVVVEVHGGHDREGTAHGVLVRERGPVGAASREVRLARDEGWLAEARVDVELDLGHKR